MSAGVDVLGEIAVVLVEPSHPGNIGATARAMKTMGLRRLRLVAPVRFPHAEASSRASGATDVLAAAAVFPDLEGALADTRWVAATTARSRELSLPVRDPEAAAGELVAQVAAGGGPGALVFGRESHGLSNSELDRCDRLVAIPTAEAYSSLNLAQAVQILVYELRRAALAGEVAPPRGEPAAGGRILADLFQHWERVVRDVGFLNPQNPDRTFRRLRQLVQRAAPSEAEVMFLRGFLSAIEKRIHGPRRRPGKGGKGPGGSAEGSGGES